MEMTSMPFDLKEEISSRLLPHDATRMKMVCMEWNTMLSTSMFVNVHLRKMRMQNKFSPIIQDQIAFSPIVYERRGQNVEAYQRLVTDDDLPSEIVAYCRGLTCETTINDEMFIVNPVTTEKKEIPHASIEWDPTADWASTYLYMGYDAAKDDYVFLRIVIFNNFKRSSQVKVYSCRLNIWRSLGELPFEAYISKFSCFVRGKIHFQTHRSGCWAKRIGTFNVHDDSWGEIDPPIQQDVQWGERILWGIWDISWMDDDTLLISPVVHVDYKVMDFEFLLLQGYGVNEAWTKYVIRFNPDEFMPNSFIPQPLFRVKPCNRKILFRRDPIGTLFSYDLFSGEMEEDPFEDGVDHFGYCRIINVTRSMVCPSNL